jgi:cytochrome bd-type quinol oxidase subunit 1
MKVRQSWILVVAFVIGCLLLGVIVGQPTSAQQPAKPAATHYQLSTVPPNGGSPGAIVVLDTSTGRCWQRSLNGGNWQDLGSPPGAK